VKQSRDWSRIKGFRDKQPPMPVFVIDTNICQVVFNSAKFEFWTEVPLDQPLKWGRVHGCRVDDRPIPPLPVAFEKVRPLRTPDKNTPRIAKKTAYGVILANREKALAKLQQPSLFTDLPVQTKKPLGHVA